MANGSAPGCSEAVGGWSQWGILAVPLSTVAVPAQLWPDSATTAIYASAAFGLAGARGHSAATEVAPVAMNAIASVLTPMDHSGDLLIQRPGHYPLAEFAAVGTPLTARVGAILRAVH